MYHVDSLETLHIHNITYVEKHLNHKKLKEKNATSWQTNKEQQTPAAELSQN